MLHEDTDVARALADAARSISMRGTVDETLDAIVTAARVSVPGFDQVGISLTRKDGTVETRAATGELVLELDALQYEFNEGPCVDAMKDETYYIVEHAAQETRWPQFMPRAVAAGVKAQMGLQLYSEDDTLGALNLYSTLSETIDDGAVHIAELFAVHAAVALGHARRESQLATALDSRSLIGTAIGLVMGRYQIDRDRAFKFLLRASSTSNIKLRDIAAEVVDKAEAELRDGNHL